MNTNTPSLGVGILGFGTVGAGVAEGLIRHTRLIEQRSGIAIRLAGIADLDIESDRGIDVDPALLTTDAKAMIDRDDVHIVVETIGGTSIAKDLILQALKAGKPVVTANKALLAECGDEVFAAAAETGTDLFYEASVAGGIPVIKALREGLSGNEIQSIYGIMNGTCNYILTRMEREPLSFVEVLADAQALGFAEAEPSLDVDGLDTAHKACILASLAFGQPVEMRELHVEGINGIAAEDLGHALELGYRIKLLAVIKRHGEQLEVRVHPTLIPADHLLGKVDGVFNAVLIQGDLVGETLYYGQGAGRFPTASAVLGDVVDVARNLALNCPGRIRPQYDFNQGGNLLAMGESEVRYYLRLRLLDEPGSMGEITRVLGEHGISIASVVQKEEHFGEYVPVIVLTHACKASDFERALDACAALDVVGPGMVKMIIEDLT